MPPEPDDWRLSGQHDHLQGAELAWRPYRTWDDGWDHDHCEFCWAKFAVSAGPEDDALTEGFATTASHPNGEDYHWVCTACFDAFADRFG